MAKAGLGLSLLRAQRLFAGGMSFPLSANAQAKASPSPPFSDSDEALLEDIEKAGFKYFWTQAHPETGMVLDRCDARNPVTSEIGSIAATGFGLTAICVGEKRGYISSSAAQDRVLNTLRFLWKKLPNHRGFFYHFANINTGERIWDSEVSSVDTAMLLCGALTCRQYFKDKAIGDLAHAIFDRVDWTWLSEDTTLLSHGWTPEMGFIHSRWDDYSELMMMYLLGMGSTSHPLAPATWNAWKRQIFEYDGLQYVGSFAPGPSRGCGALASVRLAW